MLKVVTHVIWISLLNFFWYFPSGKIRPDTPTLVWTMSSLSSVVSDLVRAQMGESVPGSVTNEDLDRHVAELIIKEAKKKAELYMQTGIRAYTTNNLYANSSS